MKSNIAKRIILEAWARVEKERLNVGLPTIYDLQYGWGTNEAKITVLNHCIIIQNLHGKIKLPYPDIDQKPEEAMEELLEWASTPKKHWRYKNVD